jgi:hypothetical protein
MSVTRDKPNEHGVIVAECNRCGMVWCESAWTVELLPGEWTTPGPRDHECPEPLPRDLALALCHVSFPISSRMAAAARLALSPDATLNGES